MADLQGSGSAQGFFPRQIFSRPLSLPAAVKGLMLLLLFSLILRLKLVIVFVLDPDQRRGRLHLRLFA